MEKILEKIEIIPDITTYIPEKVIFKDTRTRAILVQLPILFLSGEKLSMSVGYLHSLAYQIADGMAFMAKLNVSYYFKYLVRIIKYKHYK